MFQTSRTSRALCAAAAEQARLEPTSGGDSSTFGGDVLVIVG